MINIQTTLKLSAEYMGNVDHSNFDSWYERGLEIIGINALVCLAIIAVSIRLAYLQCLPRHFVTNEYLLLGQHLPADTYFPLPYFWNYAMVSFDCGVFLHCIDPGCSRHCWHTGLLPRPRKLIVTHIIHRSFFHYSSDKHIRPTSCNVGHVPRNMVSLARRCSYSMYHITLIRVYVKECFRTNSKTGCLKFVWFSDSSKCLLEKN